MPVLSLGFSLCRAVPGTLCRHVGSLLAIGVLGSALVPAHAQNGSANDGAMFRFVVTVDAKRSHPAPPPKTIKKTNVNTNPTNKTLVAPVIIKVSAPRTATPARTNAPFASRLSSAPRPTGTVNTLLTSKKLINKGTTTATKPGLKVPPKVASRLAFKSNSPALSATWQAAAVEIVAAGRGRINYEAGVIKAIGLGAIAPPTMRKSRSQDILDARDAAFNDAVRHLSIAVSQVRVTADTRVSNYVMKNDDVRLRVDTIVKNPEVIEEKLLPKSGVYRVVVQARLNGHNSLLEAIEQDIPRPTASPTPKPLATPAPISRRHIPFAPGTPAPEDAEYTSLIVDCRGLRINSCMSPRIYDTEGNEVYGTMKISPDYVIETGIAAFPRSASEARQCNRAGRKPLVVRAIGVADQNRFYPVISLRNADMARSANESGRFFERTAVILLIDPDR